MKTVEASYQLCMNLDKEEWNWLSIVKDDLRKETEQQISQVKDELKTLWISEQLKFLSVKIVHPSIHRFCREAAA